MKILNQIAVIASLCLPCLALAVCDAGATVVNASYSQDEEISLLKSGSLTSTTNPNLLAYIDEAIAMRNGKWDCSSKTALFDAAAKRKGVPDGKILYSLAMNETKRNGKPYPWTINGYGRGYFFNTREDAYSAAKWLVDHNLNLFDIGIMQVNWKYHHKRFNSLWDAFQPSTNIDAASDILLENYRETGDWVKAVKYYHNRTSATRGKVYFTRFVKHFEDASNDTSKS